MLPNVLPRSAADHVPVLAEEVRELLAVRPGRPSSTRRSAPAVTRACSPRISRGEGKLVAIDRDPTAKSYFDRFKAGAGVDVRFLRGDFSLVLAQLAANDVRADAILLDVGVSSMQIDRPERGFSYATDAPLDMRMDPTSEPRPPRRSSTRGTSASSPTCSGATARSATRGRSRARSCDGGPSVRSSARASSSRRSSRRSRRRRGSARVIRPSASSRRCASRSTTSWARSRRRCRRRSRCYGRAAGSP